MPRPLPPLGLLLLIALTALPLLAPAQSHAHAVLLQAEPAPQQLVPEPPSQVRLSFSERVSLRLGGLDVFGPDGRLASRGPGTADDRIVTAGVTSDAVGTYAVSWRVISADGHPVRGAFVFSAGERSAASAAQKKALAEAKADRGVSIAFGIVRFGYIGAILLAAGAAIFAAVVAPGWSPRLIAPALLAVIGFSVLAFFLQAAIAGNLGVLETLDGDVIEAQLSTLYGNGVLVRVGLALLGLLALRLARPLEAADRTARIAVAAVLVLLAGSLSLSGHAMATAPTLLRLPLDMLHVVVAAAWIGGLVQLHRYLSRASVDPGGVVRYSRLALGSVIVLVATGTYAALAESDVSLQALVDTSYGRVLAVKLGLFALTMPIANVNRSRHVPAIAAGRADGPARLRRYVRYEMAILLGVLGLTAWLVEVVPARHARHTLRAAPAPVVETRTVAGGARVTLSVEPGATGPNSIAVTVRTPAGQPDEDVDQVTVTASLNQQRISRLDLGLRRAGPGRWNATGRVLPLAGRWRFDVAVRRGEFDEVRTEIHADIRSPQVQP